MEQEDSVISSLPSAAASIASRGGLQEQQHHQVSKGDTSRAGRMPDQMSLSNMSKELIYHNNHGSQLSPAIETEQDADSLPPPIGVVLVSSSSAASSLQGLVSASSSGRNAIPMASSFLPFAAPFRLQPRGGLATVVSATPGRGDEVRGRKRSAQSMSISAAERDAERDALLVSSTPIRLPIAQAASSSYSSKNTQEEERLVPLHLPRNDKHAPSSLGGTTSIASAPTMPLGRPPASTPPRSGRKGMGSTLMNFQCLSLQSPKRRDLPHFGSPSALASPPEKLPEDLVNAVMLPSSTSSSSNSGSHMSGRPPIGIPSSVGSFQSQQAHNNRASLPPRSSFTPVFNAASPSVGSFRSVGSASIGSNVRMHTPVGAAKTCGSFSPLGGASGCGSTKSSPKFAPLTVLKDHGNTVLPVRENQARLPPLPGGGMNSLWLSLESSSLSDKEMSPESSTQKDDESFRMRPPRTVHCRRPSTDSISTVQNSVLSLSPRTSFPFSPGKSIFSAIGGNTSKPSTPRSNKQARLEECLSSIQRTPRTPNTPLPRVTLTPRSTGSRRSGHENGLPRFPSPSDIDIMDVTSPFLSSTGATTTPRLGDVTAAAAVSASSRLERTRGGERPAMRTLFPESSNSLALSADGSANECGNREPAFASAFARGAGPERPPQAPNDGSQSPIVRDFSGGFMGAQSQSLLTGSRPGGILQAMLEEGDETNGDWGSMSDLDDDEGFVLACPGAIEAERLARHQPARQRRRHSTDQSTGRASPNASNSNLVGMNYVPSNTSLFGMDIAHPPEASASGGLAGNAETGPFPEAGMPDEPTTPVASGSSSAGYPFLPASHPFMHRRKSDASSGSIGLALEGPGAGTGRDMVTPPPMPNPSTPPPLSPKDGFFMPMVQNNGFTGDSDMQSIAIARMMNESKHHADRSPVS